MISFQYDFTKNKLYNMKKRKFLQTDFIKFIIEKYGQDLPDDDEVEIPQDEKEDPLFRKKIKLISQNEIEDDDETNDEDDEIIDELVNEYKKLKKKYESNKIRVRRKR